MYHLDNTSGVPEMPEPKETQTISTRWFGESQEQGGISWPGADWFNIMQAEMLNLLAAAGLQPEKHVFDQLSIAIPVLGDAKLRADLLLSGDTPGAAQVKLKKGMTVQAGIDDLNANRLSFYGDDSDALHNLLQYAASSARQCVIDTEINLTTPLFFNADGAVINLKFTAPVNSDTQLLTLSNLGRKSVIEDAWFQNITAPWIITRFDSDGNWLSTPEEVLATLRQTNEEVGYQPTSSDKVVWDGLSDEIKNQFICAGLIIEDSDEVTLIRPKGRHMGLVFNNCNYCCVERPDFMPGRHMYGAILFNNTFSQDYGRGNKVEGGVLRYGSVSGIVFMRNKGYDGGVFNFKNRRVGESGVKTYQNNINGVSARSYELTFDSITSIQPFYDGVDVFSDYGEQEERLYDHSISEYAWGLLPTRHSLNNITVKDCHGAGVTGDGQFNEFTNIHIDGSYSSGFFNSGENNYLTNVFVKDGNRNNADAGAQIRFFGKASIQNAKIVTTEGLITKGSALYCPYAGSSLKNINTDLTSLPSAPKHIADQDLFLGKPSSTASRCSVRANPRPTLMANDCAGHHYELTFGVSGAEQGQLIGWVTYNGVEIPVFRGRGENGGFFIARASSGYNTSLLNANEYQVTLENGMFYFLGKKADGTVVKHALAAS